MTTRAKDSPFHIIYNFLHRLSIKILKPFRCLSDRYRETRTTKVENLPIDIMCQILCRLPVKSLLRFRCVSKLYLETIDDPEFTRSHHARISRRTLLLGSNDVEDGSEIFQLEENDLEYYRPTTAASPLIYKPKKFLCSAEGFVLLLLEDNQICFCNPSRRESIVLPWTSIDSKKIRSLGLGFDSTMNEYKIVFTSFNSALIYSSKTKSWKQSDNRPPPLPWCVTYSRSGVFLNGSIHWIYHAVKRREYEILSFDVMTEEFSLAKLDFDSDIRAWDNRPGIMELGGYLAIAEPLGMRGRVRLEKVMILTDGKWKLKNIVNIDQQDKAPDDEDEQDTIGVDHEPTYENYYYVNDEGLEWTSSGKLVNRSLIRRIFRCKETLISVNNF